MSQKLLVSFSSDAEAAVRRVVSEHDLLPTASTQAKQVTARALIKSYESAVAAGFSHDAVKAALESFHRRGSLSEAVSDSLLDYLCFQSEFIVPSKFQATRASSTAGGVSVLSTHRADVLGRGEPERDRAVVDVSLTPLAAVESRADTSAADNKAWILSYVDEDSQSESRSASSQSQSEDDSVEPASAPPFDSLIEPAVAREKLGTALVRAQALAKAAKAASNAALQREAGTTIRDIKQHMLRLGLTEEECVADASVDAHVLPELPDAQIAEADGMCDLFDENATSAPLPVVPKGRKKTAAHASVTRIEPRAMLQQLCKQRGWTAPRFERVQTPSRGVFQYYVVVEQTLAGKKKQLMHCSMPGEYNSVEKAQQMAACAALVRLFEGLDCASLSAPYDDIAYGLMEEAELAGKPVIDRESIITLVNTLLQTSADGQRSIGTTAIAADDEAHAPSRAKNDRSRALQPYLLKRLESLQTRSDYRALAEHRANLPIAAIRGTLSSLLYGDSGCDAVLVVGETGSGKTTQVPQYVLDDATLYGHECNVVVTQPRRIAAISVAERVAAERMEPAPGSTETSVVGYHVRNDAATSPYTRLLFCTMGILLRQMHGDQLLSSIAAVVLDEVHERSLEVDLLLTLLRDLPARRRAAGLPPVKLVLMSATINAAMFSTYMGGCPVLTADGRMFPVTSIFLPDIYETTQYILPPDSPAAIRRKKGQGDPILPHTKANMLLREGWGDTEADAEPLNPDFDATAYAEYSQQTRVSLSRLNEEVVDLDLLEEVLFHIDSTQGPGAALVFVPGIKEVDRLCMRLGATKRFGNCVVLPLHSALPATDQRAVFRTYSGRRKMVISTNIAETSLTIPDVVFVVDSGRQRSKHYDSKRSISSLQEEWVSQANARQRSGRAGRVQAGFYYALYTPTRAQRFRASPIPEVQRIPLSEAALQIALLDVGQLHDVFARMPEPPAPEAVNRALLSLQEESAMDAELMVTPLGRHLANLPVNIPAGKLLIHGVIMGCTRHALTLAAFMGNDRSPFMSEAADRLRTAFAAPTSDGVAAGQFSDHMVMLDVFEAWRSHDKESKAADFANRNGLSHQVLSDIDQTRSALAELLSKAGFLPSKDWLRAGA